RVELDALSRRSAVLALDRWTTADRLRPLGRRCFSVVIPLILVFESMRSGALSRLAARKSDLRYCFEEYALDTDRRELCRLGEIVAVEPQIFDLLVYLIRNRERVVSQDDLLTNVWGGRIVSESTLRSSINAARRAIGDNGQDQRLIRTL